MKKIAEINTVVNGLSTLTRRSACWLLAGTLLASCGLQPEGMPHPQQPVTPVVQPEVPAAQPAPTPVVVVPGAGMPVGTSLGSTSVFVTPNAEEVDIIQLVNELRVKGTLQDVDAISGSCAEGNFKPGTLRALSYGGPEAYAARQHARWLGVGGVTVLTQPVATFPAYYGASASDRFLRAYQELTGTVPVSWGLAENVAGAQQDVLEVMWAWMKSPGHCHNLMNPELKRIGTGYYFNPAVNGHSDEPNGVKRYARSWAQVFSY